jgi:uncharacterized membrane protein YcaP (DUF421 family)
MKKEEIKIEDIRRILFGEAPVMFAFEVLIRTTIVYLGLLLALKLLGKRMTGQLTITEMAVMITLGAIVSVPMQMPDRGMLQGLLILLLAVLFLRGINYLSFKKKKAEVVIQGKVNILVTDGIIDLQTLRRLNISKQQLFSVLRNKQIFQLGAVKRVYIEACGLFSVYENENKQPGLPLYPSEDSKLLNMAKGVRESACSNCGKVAIEPSVCDHCGNDKFVPAIIN